jgi:hypothetical protein
LTEPLILAATMALPDIAAHASAAVTHAGSADLIQTLVHAAPNAVDWIKRLVATS